MPKTEAEFEIVRIAGESKVSAQHLVDISYVKYALEIANARAQSLLLGLAFFALCGPTAGLWFGIVASLFGCGCFYGLKRRDTNKHWKSSLQSFDSDVRSRNATEGTRGRLSNHAMEISVFVVVITLASRAVILDLLGVN